MSGAAVATIEKEFKYLVRDEDRHGNERYYIRRRGQPKIRIRAPVGSAEFDEEYRKAISAIVELKPVDPTKHVPAVPGTFDALILAACNSVEWKALDAVMVRSRRHILEDWANTLSEKSKRRFGGVKAIDVTIGHVRRRRDALSVKQSDAAWEKAGKVIGRLRKPTRPTGGPGAANNFVKAVRALFQWAVGRSDETKITVNPVAGLKRLEYVQRQYHVWTPAELEAYRMFWAVGTKQRLAAELGIGTGQRPSDIRQFGRQHIKRAQPLNELHYTQWKGRNRKPMQMVTPILPELQAAIDAMTEGKTLVFIASNLDKGYTEHGFFNAFKDWCRQAGVAECSPHGLRILGAVNFLEMGIPLERLMAWFGWRTMKQALHYAQTFNRAHMNRETAAMLLGLLDQMKNKSVPLSDAGDGSGTKTSAK